MWLRPSTTWPSCTRQQGKYADAEALYKRALAIQEKALGADHPDVAATPQQPGHSCTASKASTPTPRGSTSARWRSARRRSAQTTPMWRRTLNNLAIVYDEPRQVRRRRGALQARAGDQGEGARRRPSPVWPHPQQPGRRVPRTRQVRRRRGALQARAGDLGEGARRRPPRCGRHPQQPGQRVLRARQVRRRRGALQARPGDHGEGARRQTTRMWPTALINLAIIEAELSDTSERTRLFAQGDGRGDRSCSHRDARRAGRSPSRAVSSRSARTTLFVMSPILTAAAQEAD